MNDALRSEGPNASGSVEHLPFHFDYLEVREGIRSALAFQHDDAAFRGSVAIATLAILAPAAFV